MSEVTELKTATRIRQKSAELAPTFASEPTREGILRQPIHGPFYGLTNRKFVVPTGLPYLGCVQEDKRLIANPTPVSAGILQCRTHFELLTYPGIRIFELAIFVFSITVDF